MGEKKKCSTEECECGKSICDIRGKFSAIIAIIITVCFFSLNVGPTVAKVHSGNIVKVGFPIQHGISYIDENGNYAGYLVDYLNYLRFYTNWDIEYVQVEGDLNRQLITLLGMLEDGQIDIMGTMNRNEALEEMYLYPTESYGTAYTTLAVHESDGRWLPEDYEHWNGIKIATYSGLDRRMGLFEQFASVNGFTYEEIEYETFDEVIEAVRQGKADATLQVDMSMVDDFYAIARFSPSPYYFALYKGNTDLLDQMDIALSNIDKAFPYLKNELYNQHFGYSTEFYITDEEKEFIKKLGKVNIMFFDGNAPFQYTKGGKLKGAIDEYIDIFADETGLEYETFIASDSEEGKKLLETGQIDIIAGIPTTSEIVQTEGIRFSLPIFFSDSVLVHTKRYKNGGFSEPEVMCVDAEKALETINDYEPYAVKIDGYSLEYYRQKQMLVEDLESDLTETDPFAYSVAVTEEVPDRLLEIINRYASSYNEIKRQSLVYKYASDSVEYSLSEYIYQFRYAILAIAIILFIMLRYRNLLIKNRISLAKIVEKEKEVTYISSYDTLTGAFNEKKFKEMFEEDCKKKVPKALAVLNTRDFKYINEVFTSDIGDRLLVREKEILDEITREGEYFCRQSSDMFYLALNVKNEQEFEEKAELFFEKLQIATDELLNGFPISVYWGVVFTDSSPESFSVSANYNYMLSAMAQAKKRNTSDICFYNNELHEMEKIRHFVESHMYSALENEEFKVYLQPKMNLETNKIDNAEALVRWMPEEGKMMYPNQFIPLFKENGFCMKLDLYMVERVCRKLREWIDAGIEPIGISVNQTKLLFMHAGYVDSISKIARKYRIDPGLITLELLEGMAMEKDIIQLNECITKLKQAGFRISLDDFGSGYSSLNVLGDLDIDEVKVDRVFLMSAAQKENYPRRYAIGEQIIGLAKKIDVHTVAEGVETEEDDRMIRDFKYDYGQGYYYGRPIHIDEFCRKYLKNN